MQKVEVGTNVCHNYSIYLLSFVLEYENFEQGALEPDTKENPSIR